MRWTQSFIPTLKETPADAENISHKLLLRAGLVVRTPRGRKVTPKAYKHLGKTPGKKNPDQPSLL